MGCDRSTPLPTSTSTAPAPERAPDVSWQMNGEEVSLASLRGRTVLLHFADAASPSWAALDEAYGDLSAEGATVLGIVTDAASSPGHLFETTSSDDLETAFQITTTPSAIVIDPEGWVRGRDHALDADAFFALAAPVLLDEGVHTAVSVPEGRQLDAEGLDRLVRAGAVLIDVRPDIARAAEGWVPLALPCPLEALTAEYLPADLSATLIFLGPDADAASEQAANWGYVSVLGLADATPYVRADATPDELAPSPEVPLSTPRRVRG